MRIDTLVVTDLDGSLWHDERCHPATLAALERLESAGVPVLVATGRRIGSARRGFDANDLAFPAVLLNGALGHDFVTGRRFHSHAFTSDDVAAVFDVFDSFGLSPCIYTDDGLVHAFRPTTSEGHLATIGDDLVPIERPREVPRERSVLSFSMLGIARTRVEEAARTIVELGLGEAPCYADGIYDEWSIMVQAPGISKWQGIQAWLADRDAVADRIVAIGDGGNDLEMLAAADVAVAVEGGDPRALGLADVVIPPPERGGWARVLDLVD